MVCANTGPAASEMSAKAAIMVFIFDLHLFERKASVRMELAGTGENELTKNVSREAGLKKLKSVSEINFASHRKNYSFVSKLSRF